MNFQPIKPSDYAGLNPFFEKQTYPLCEYSLSSIIVWGNEKYHSCGAVYGDSLLIYADFAQCSESSHLILPISPGKEVLPEDLEEISRLTGYGSYWFVPEEYIIRHAEKGLEKIFNIERQEGYDDYLYRTEDLATLAGRKYSKKRNLIKQFEGDYSEEKGNLLIKVISREDVPGCLDFLDRWCEERDCGHDRDEYMACEWRAAQNALKNIDSLGFRSIMLLLDGAVQAFGIASQITEKSCALHFQKASYEFKGLYQFFDRECARKLFPELEYINKESDMGVEGLIQSKRSYYPIAMVKSYKLELKQG